MTFKTLTTTAAALALLASSVTAVSAAGSSNCQVIYGGGEVCPPQIKITVDKKVATPSTQTKGGQASYVDNLYSNNEHYAPTQDVSYKITVTNNSDKTLNNIVVTDTLPQNLVFADGSRTYTKTIDSLDAGKSQDLFITARVVDTNSLQPNNQAVICDNTTNNVRVTVDNASFSDSAQICIEKKNIPAKVFQTPPMKTTPNTGPEMLSLLALIPTGAAGILLRRKSK